MAQGDLTLAGVLRLRRLREVVGQRIVHPAEQPLVDGDADERAVKDLEQECSGNTLVSSYPSP